MKRSQEVICIKANYDPASKQHVIEGKLYVIQNTIRCGCSDLVDIGLVSIRSTVCPNCKQTMPGLTWWNLASRFVPLDDIDISELDEVLQSDKVEK
jgi:hypothetical protein